MNKFLGISASSRVSLLSKQRGAVSIAAALSMTALMGVGAMAVDVGNVMVARNDVQNAADAAALRGAGLLYTQGSSSPDFSAMNNSPNGPVYTTADLNTPIEKQDT
ncbi:secreted protein, partial [mine drainage metagenome]